MPRSRSRSGFSLIELAVVVGILGLMAGAVSLRVRDSTSYNLKHATRKMQSKVKYLFAQSAFRKQPYRLVWDLKENTYAVQMPMTHEDGTVEFVDDGGKHMGTTHLPKNVQIKDVQTASAGKKKTGTTYTQFYAHGFVEPTVVHLQDDHKRELTLQFIPLTGMIRVYEGYEDFKQ